MVNVWAVVPSRAQDDRLHRCVAALEGTPTVVIDNGVDPDALPLSVYTLKTDPEPRNISRWWNTGIEHVLTLDPDVSYVALVNDDATVPMGWATYLANTMRQHGAAAGFTWDGPTTLRTHPYISLYERITGWAFIIRTDLRFDEDFVWHYGDDDADYRASLNGGVLALNHSARVQHSHPNESTNTSPELTAQSQRDRETFHRKWRKYPW